ncbi:MAG: hypothetical protein LBI49_06400 [Nocardiopsaceae bacterium]|jgi:hypothetical protein|nr:hypothetical protein [Nocardiopsaceae bacterium]
MKAYLMHPDRDFDLNAGLPPGEPDLTQDLELGTLLAAMARGNEFLLTVARRALLCSLRDPDAIRYRQRVLADCLANPAVVREIYDLAVAAIAGEKRVFRGIFAASSPEALLSRSVEVLGLFAEQLRKLRAIADAHAPGFRSDGFTRFFLMLAGELSDEYFGVMAGHLRTLKFSDGTLISAGLTAGNRGAGYVLRRPRDTGLLLRAIPALDRTALTMTIPDRDESGLRALGELQGRGLNLVANALAQSTDHILSFFGMLCAELGFYVGCLNLHEQLTGKGEPVCFPDPVAPVPGGPAALSAAGLYDPCLALTVPGPVVGNDAAADGTSLVMITGANQGGKSTFLRSAGLAHLMMQCGMFVAAGSFRSDICQGFFTHYKRAEDASMTSGKLDEELSRMSEIAGLIRPGCLLLCNESFASTNEREGSEIARQVVRAMLDQGVRVCFVTHQFDLAQWFFREYGHQALFLRAQRREDGQRTFRLAAGEPLATSFGQDVYQRVFADGDGGTGGAGADAAAGQASAAGEAGGQRSGRAADQA